MIRNFDELKAMLATCPEKRRVGVVAAQDPHTLEAVTKAAKEGLVYPVLIGKEDEIKSILKELGFDPAAAQIIPCEEVTDCAALACDLAREGKIDCIMKGRTETGPLMKALVNKETGIRKSPVMSMLAIMYSPYYHKIFGITDVGLLTYPNLDQKKAMIENAVSAFHAMGYENPKVAVLAAVEKVNPKMPECVEADALKAMNLPGCTVEGPISLDLAMDAEAARIKDYDSPVAGDADILAVPNIVTGNVFAKTITNIGGGATCGAVLGAMVPVIITSRSATAEDKYMSIVLNALLGGVHK